MALMSRKDLIKNREYPLASKNAQKKARHTQRDPSPCLSRALLRVHT